MATLQLYPPSEAQTHTSGPFSPRLGPNSPRTYSETTQSAPISPLKYSSANNPNYVFNLPPAADSLINIEPQPSFTARLHRRKKTYQPPTAPPMHASQPHDPLRAARLAWRLQEEYAEQLRADEEAMRHSAASLQRQQRDYIRQTAPAQTRTRKRRVRSKWQAFVLWFKLGVYRITRGVRNIFK